MFEYLEMGKADTYTPSRGGAQNVLVMYKLGISESVIIQNLPGDAIVILAKEHDQRKKKRKEKQIICWLEEEYNIICSINKKEQIST